MNAWRVVELLGVLAEESRYGLVVTLAQAGDDGLPQSRLAMRSGLSVPRLKRHLAKLVKAGIVRRNHRKKAVFWKIDERQLGDLFETLKLKLELPSSKRNGHAVVIEVPKGFRSLASKLANVGLPAEPKPRTIRRTIAKPSSKSPAKRQLPARLLEAIDQRVGTEASGSPVETSHPAPAPRPAPVIRRQATAHPVLAAPADEARAGRKRKLPTRLSDAIAGASG